MTVGDPLFLVALAAGALFAWLAAPLGAFVVWRRMAYFGEALAHATLLGVGIGLLAGAAPDLAVPPLMIGVALVFAVLERHARIPADTLLAILAHGSLALGILLIAATGGPRIDLTAYLFGDILAVGRRDLALLAAVSALTLVLLALCWRGLLSATTSEELAQVEGVRVGVLRLGLVVVLALAVALGTRIVGLLLVMALMLVPVAAVRPFVRSPEGMVLAAGVLGSGAVLGGLVAAFRFDWPAGPAIAVCAVALFLLAQLSTALRPGSRRP